MPIYTSEYLKGLKSETDLKEYTRIVSEFVESISKSIITSSLKGDTEKSIKVRIMSNYHKITYTGLYNEKYIIINNTAMMNSIIDELKLQFIDSQITYVESKDWHGKVLETAIRISWG